MKTRIALIAFLAAGFAIAAAGASEFAAVRCKEWPAAGTAHRLYTNRGLERSGGTDHDADCRDVFYGLMRDRDPRSARMVYELKEKELFPAIEEALATARAHGAKIEIRFSLPEEGEPDPEALTQIDVLLRARIRE